MINKYKYILVIIISLYFVFTLNNIYIEKFKDKCDCKNIKNDIKLNSIELEINKLKIGQEKLKKNQKIIQKKIKSAEDVGKESETNKKLI